MGRKAARICRAEAAAAPADKSEGLLQVLQSEHGPPVRLLLVAGYGCCGPYRLHSTKLGLAFSITGSDVGAFSQANASRSSASSSSSCRSPQPLTAALTASARQQEGSSLVRT